MIKDLGKLVAGNYGKLATVAALSMANAILPAYAGAANLDDMPKVADPLSCESEVVRVARHLKKSGPEQLLYVGSMNMELCNREGMERFVSELGKLTKGRYKIEFHEGIRDWIYNVESNPDAI